jgi:hypothetical protein
MITYLDERGVDRLFYFSLVVFAVFTISLLFLHFTLLRVLVLLIPGLILAGLYPYAKRNYSDYLYYFVLDGLMMLSALLMWILPI